MIKRTFNSRRADRHSRWSAAIVSAALVWSVPTTLAQSMLRFVGPDTTPVASEELPQPTTSVAPASPHRSSEFRLVEMTEGQAAALPQFSVSARNVKVTGQSTLSFGAALPLNPQVTGSDVIDVNSYDLRFKPSTSAMPVPGSAPSATPTAAAISAAATQPVIKQRPLAGQPAAIEQKAADLFANSPVAVNPYQPRIAMAIDHVPAPAPQHADARPVHTARETTPAFIAPAGTELFGAYTPGIAMVESTIATNTPKQWELPVVDYGATLRQVQPELPTAVNSRPIEPRRVIARELPHSAVEMFGVGATETSISRTKQTPSALTPPFSQISGPTPKLVEGQPLSTINTRLTRQQLQVAVAPPDGAVDDSLALPVVAATKPIATTPVAATSTTVAPVTSTTQGPHIALAPPKLPTASELDFFNVTRAQELPKPQFAPTTDGFAGTTPVSSPAVQQELLPPSITAATESKLPFSYQSRSLHDQPHVADYSPAPVAAAAVQARESSQLVANIDPQDSNTYKLSLAASSGQPNAMYVNRTEPSAHDDSIGTETIPGALPAHSTCNCGPYGQCGCPYLPGQSGTRALCGVDCGRCGSSCTSTWSDATCIPWALLGPGEYVGPARPAHVETYYLRVNDLITLTFIQSRKKSAEHYRIGVGDQMQIEWLQGASNTEKALDRDLLVQPDGTVTLPLIGEVNAAGKTVNDFRDEVVKLYSKFQRDPQITITPLTVNVAAQDVLKAVTAKNATSGQMQDVRVTPEGTIQAAGVGSVYVQGLTLDELRSELEARYVEAYGPGISVSPQLTERATSYVFIGGEVRSPGRYVLEGPTTVMQAITQAGGWNIGGNLHQVVIFRRDENWCLKATKIDVRAPLYGKDPCPTNDVWLRDNDLVIVPKSCILCATDMINLYFTRGIYAVFPITYVYDFSQNSGLVPIGP